MRVAWTLLVLCTAAGVMASAAAQRLARAVSRVTDVRRYADKNIVVDFGDYERTSPILGLAEDFMREGEQGFPDHPHRGFETVSLVLKGRQRHGDSTGHSGVLEAGSVLWMTAGSGIIHSEFPDGPELCHTLQLWFNLPAALKMTKPRYQQYAKDELPVVRDGAAEITVMTGAQHGVRGPITTHTPATCAMARVQAGACAALDLPGPHNGFVYVLEGAGRFGRTKRPARQGQVLWFDPVADAPAADGVVAPADVPSSIPVEAEQELHLLLFGGEPIREPVYHQGPFVLHTPEALQQAFIDYRTGNFLRG